MSDRPWGATLGTIWHRQVTGRLTVHGGGERVVIGFRGGAIVSVTSTPYSMESEPMRRAARPFAFEHGTFVLDDEPPRLAHAELDTRAVIYFGARFLVTEQRLVHDLRLFGSRFKLVVPDSELVHYGIAPSDPAIARLRTGTSVEDHDRHATRAAIYALASCRACAIERIPAGIGLAAGTERVPSMTTPPMVAPRRVATPPLGVRSNAVPGDRGRFPTPSNGVPVATERIPTSPRPRGPTEEPRKPDLAKVSEAKAAASRGQIALDAKQYKVAIAEVTSAIDLDPDRVTYRAMLAWAEFCAAPDKEAIAEATRRALAATVPRSEDPVMPVYLLACVAKALGRDREALRLYQRVVHLAPEHQEARAEVRALLDGGGKRGLLDRFRR
ncbi:MAG: hypothetical protein M4D80_22810 [Myxococcota bacterium]|nr:hypothetical protein [Myxococcota bacterium]